MLCAFLLLLSSLIAMPLLSSNRILSSPSFFPSALAEEGQTSDGIVTNDDFFTVYEDSTASFLPVLDNDYLAGNSSTSISILAVPTYGTVSTDAGNSTTDASVAYTPASQFFGEDSFIYAVSTADGNDTALVTVVVVPVNDPPIAIDYDVTTLQNASIDIDVTLNDQDIDGDVIEIITINMPVHGTTELVNDDYAKIRYRPDSQYTGQDSFTYVISDGNGADATATVLINVLSPDPVTSPGTDTNSTETTPEDPDSDANETIPASNNEFNDGPIALAGRQQIVNEGATVVLNGTGSYDPDDDILSYAWNQTAGPSVLLNDAKTAMPTFLAPSVTGSADDVMLTFQLLVNDGKGGYVSDFVDIIVKETEGSDTAGLATFGVTASSSNSLYAYSPSFTGTGSSYFSIADTSALHLQRFSVAAWFKTSSSFSGNAMIVNKGGLGSDSSGQNMNYGIWMNSDEKIVAGFESSAGTGYYYASSSKYNDGDWHYVVVTFNGSDLKIIIDGDQVASKHITAKPETGGKQPLRIGANSRELGNYFKGQVDEVRVFNRAITMAEIENHHSQGTVDTTGQVAYMDGVKATTGSGAGGDDEEPPAPDDNDTQTHEPDTSAVFDASGSNYFSIPYQAQLMKIQKFSLAAWFKTSSVFSTDAAIVNRGGFGSESSGQNTNYGIWMDANKKIVAGFETSSGTNYFVTSSSTYNNGKWHHAVVTYDGSTIKLFIDGKQIASKKTTAKPDANGTQPLRLGANSRGSSNYFKGQIDEAKLWNKALTASEVSGLFKEAAITASVTAPIPEEIVFMDGMTYYLSPIANAGSDQTVKEENYANLDGTGSFDPDNIDDDSLLSFLWTQTDGPSPATITDPASSKTTFKAPAVVGSEAFTFQLTVSDGRYSASNTVKITVQDDTSKLPRILKTPDYFNDVANAIKSSDDYVYAAMYYVEAYSSNKVLSELAKAKSRGVSIKLVIAEQSLDLFPNLPKQLKAKGIPFHIDSVHAKVVVIDGRLVYVGSANWNKNGLEGNWELSYKSNNPSTIAEAKEYVNNLWHRGSPIVSHSSNYSERFVNGDEYVDLVVGYLKNADKSIKVLMFEAQYDFKRPNSAPSKILWEVKNADKRGVNLQMVLDDPRYYNNTGGPEFLKKYDVPHKLDEKRSGYLEKKHAKVFLIDDSILVIGSHNWNKDSADSSQEASIITRDPNAIADFKSLFNKQWDIGKWKIKP